MTADDNADAQPVIPQEDPFDPWDILKRQAAEYTGTVAVLDAIDRARSAVHAQHAQEIARLKEELESTPYGKMRRALILRAEAAEAQIVTRREQLQCVICRSDAEKAPKSAEVCSWHHQKLQQRLADEEAENDTLSAQLHAKDHEIEQVQRDYELRYIREFSPELEKLRAQLADEQLLRRNAEAKFADLLKGQTWQPIETAPKDGTAVLGFGLHTHSPKDAQRGVNAGDHWWAIMLWDIWRHPDPTGWGEQSLWVFAKDGKPTWSHPSHWIFLPTPPPDPETCS